VCVCVCVCVCVVCALCGVYMMYVNTDANEGVSPRRTPPQGEVRVGSAAGSGHSLCACMFQDTHVCTFIFKVPN